jgi:hypothetical protein
MQALQQAQEECSQAQRARDAAYQTRDTTMALVQHKQRLLREEKVGGPAVTMHAPTLHACANPACTDLPCMHASAVARRTQERQAKARQEIACVQGRRDELRAGRLEAMREFVGAWEAGAGAGQAAGAEAGGACSGLDAAVGVEELQRQGGGQVEGPLAMEG